MAPPLALAIPTAVAALTYLNGRLRVTNDLSMIRAAGILKKVTPELEAKGKSNPFYALEERAFDQPDAMGTKRAPKTSDRECLVFEGKSWTYKQAYDQVLRVAAWLNTRFSIKPGDIVAMDFTNCEHFIFVWFGIWSLGGVPAFINYNLTGTPLLHSVKISSARILIVEQLVESCLTEAVTSELKPAVDIVVFDQQIIDTIEKLKPYRAPDETRTKVLMKDPAILIYTSGTTGMPKPAIVNWWKLYSGFYFVANWIPVTYEDRYYTAMPLYHSSASVLGVLLAMGACAPLILSRKFSVTKFWSEVRETRATMIQYVGETLRYLLAAPPSPLDTQHSVRLAFGNGLRPDIWNEFKKRFRVQTIAEFYAATESTNGFWNLSSNDLTAGAIGSMGTVLSLLTRNHFKIIELDMITGEVIRDPKTGLCRIVPPGGKGEMVLNLSDDPTRTPRERFPGYYNNKNASESKMITDVLKKGDVWFRTGDIMIHDEEGRTFFSDRIGDTFRWKSENVSTNEVSEVLGKFSGVAEANVYGIQLPHHDGRAGCAAMVFHDQVRPENLDAIMSELAKHLLTELPRYAVPIFIRVMKEEEMERTGNNKQTKHHLRVVGVDMEKLPDHQKDQIWWLKPGANAYEKFDPRDWQSIGSGAVKL